MTPSQKVYIILTKRYCQSLGFEDAYKAHIKASPIDNLNRREKDD